MNDFLMDNPDYLLLAFPIGFLLLFAAVVLLFIAAQLVLALFVKIRFPG